MSWMFSHRVHSILVLDTLSLINWFLTFARLLYWTIVRLSGYMQSFTVSQWQYWMWGQTCVSLSYWSQVTEDGISITCTGMNTDLQHYSVPYRDITYNSLSWSQGVKSQALDSTQEALLVFVGQDKYVPLDSNPSWAMYPHLTQSHVIQKLRVN